MLFSVLIILFSILWPEGQVPQHNFHPQRSRPGWEEGVPAGTGYPAPECLPRTQSGSSCQHPGLAEEADLNWRFPQGQVPRPAEPPLLREPDAQDPTGLRLLRLPSVGWSQRRPLPLGHRGGDGGACHHHLKAWTRPVGGLGEDSGAPQDTVPSLFPGSPTHPLHQARSASYLALRTTTLRIVGWMSY